MKTFIFLLMINLTICQSILKGKISDDNKSVPFARVVIKGESDYVLSGWDGSFKIENVNYSDSVWITAWYNGYYNGEVKVFPGDTNIIITLHHLPEADNKEYQWLFPHPDTLNENNCGNCHSDVIVNQWQKNAHGQSAKNPFFFAMYNGKDMEGNDSGEGFKKDFPDSDGNCTLCHIPTASLETMKGVNPNTISGVDTNGVFCDFCHKINNTEGFASADVITKNYGVQAINLLRPPAGEQIFFGPYVDVHDPDSFNPNIHKSEFCAPCHSGYFWTNYAYGSFVEWEESIYPSNNIQCQTCHMAPDGVTTNFAPGKGGIERDPSTIPSHLQPGSRDVNLLQNSVTMDLMTEQKNDTLIVEVIIKNDKTGHHVPTDRPSRNLILLVDAAIDNSGLEYIGSEKVPFWGGEGIEENDYSGKPGKGFAKVLKENKFFNPRIPAPAWVEHSIYSDNRIAAMDADTSVYYFRIDEFNKNIQVSSRLIYRRFYKKWMDEKGMDIPDIEMEKESQVFVPVIVGVNKIDELPKSFNLEQNYPNPFNPATNIKFTLVKKDKTYLYLYDVNGKLMRKIIDGKELDAGNYTVKLSMNKEASGVYFYSLKSANKIMTKKLLLIK